MHLNTIYPPESRSRIHHTQLLLPWMWASWRPGYMMSSLIWISLLPIVLLCAATYNWHLHMVLMSRISIGFAPICIFVASRDRPSSLWRDDKAAIVRRDLFRHAQFPMLVVFCLAFKSFCAALKSCCLGGISFFCGLFSRREGVTQ